ncbi:uncharacterized protein LOC142355360 [Convolutriloba macropyga]|uniref:uncharacterized protein LOC142355360 n=1 Tax=Convolutriloba macropyga TaxID=536237 RepID=UPI003F51DFB1
MSATIKYSAVVLAIAVLMCVLVEQYECMRYLGGGSRRPSPYGGNRASASSDISSQSGQRDLSHDFWQVLNDIAFLEGDEDSLNEKLPDELLSSYPKKFHETIATNDA